MKYLISLPFLLFAGLSLAQNSSPIVEITSINVDEVAQQVTLNYSLSDADNDLCEVWLKVSEDEGAFFETATEGSLSGNHGEGIAPSTELSLTWDYSNFTGFIGDVHLKLYASDNGAVSIEDMVAQVDEDQLLSYLEEIVGERH